jgi:hypothetical protein
MLLGNRRLKPGAAILGGKPLDLEKNGWNPPIYDGSG